MLANSLLRAVGVAAEPVECTFTDIAVDGVTRTTYTFSGMDLGEAASNRYIVVVAGNYDSGVKTLSSMTIGGESATEVLSVSDNGCVVSIGIAAVPTGATGDVAITWSGTTVRCGIGVYRLVNLQSSTPTATASDTSEDSGVLSASLEIPSDGCGIGYVVALGDGGARTWTWTNLTEDFDASMEETTTHSGAMSTTAGTLARTATASGSLNFFHTTLALAAWR